jgi:HK97 family phage major capsid protein
MSSANLLDGPTIGDWVTFEQAEIITGKSEGFLRSAADAGRLRMHPGGKDECESEGLARLMYEREQRSIGSLCRAFWWDRFAADRSLVPPSMKVIARDWSGLTGPDGGYLTPWTVVDEWFDRIRTSFEPLKRIKWRFTSLRQFDYTTVMESSRAFGLRYGGSVVKWGTSPGVDHSTPVALVNQPQVTVAKFFLDRFTAYGPKVSSDLIQDSGDLLSSYIEEVQFQDTAYLLMDILIGGSNYPTVGLINSPGTVTVPPEGGETGGVLQLANFDKMLARFPAGCYQSEGACWMCNQDTLLAINQLATTEVWPQTIYMPRGAYQNPWPSIYGLPLLVVEQCPAIGTPGDVILADLRQVMCAVYRPAPIKGKINSTLQVGAADGWEADMNLSIERRRSEHRYFDTDQQVFFSKFKADIQPLWAQTIKPAYSNTGLNVGPYVIIGQR